MNWRRAWLKAVKAAGAGRVPALLCLALLAQAPRALGGSFSGSSQGVSPSELNSGGSGGSSSNYNIVPSIGGAGESSYSSINYYLQPGFAALAVWPDKAASVSAAAGQEAGSLVLSWTAPRADGSTGTAAAYDIRYSTYAAGSPALSEAAFLAAPSASALAALPSPAAYGSAEQLPVAGLPGGATYYFAIKAMSSWYGWSYLSAGATAQARLYEPSFTGFTGAGENYLSAAWTSSGNAEGTRYRVLVSTAADPLSPGGALVTSSDTYNAFLSSAGLSANTTYYFRVACLAAAGNDVSAYTAAAPAVTLPKTPVPAGFSAVTETSMQFNWTRGGNPEGTLYRVAVSTAADPLAPDGAAVTVEDAYSLSLSTSGLVSNATYYFRAAAVSHDGSVSGYSAAASTSSLAAQPAYPYITGISSGAMRFNWDAGGNADGTRYRVAMSTAPDPLSPGTAAAYYYYTYELYLSTGGLAPNTVYYFRAAAVNNNGIITSYSPAVSGHTLNLGSIGSPAEASVAAVHVTSVTATWSLVSGATGYTLAASLSPAYPPVSIYASSVTVGNGALSASIYTPALSPDTVYYLFVRANGPGVSSAWLALPPAATLVEFAPVSPALSGAAGDSLRFDWASGGNPAGTMYRVIYSTADPLAPAGAAVTSSDTYNLSLDASGLGSDTRYYFRAAGLNKDGVPTAYTSAVNAATLAAWPLVSGFTEITASSARLNWSANGNPGDTTYRVIYSVSPDPLYPEGAEVFSHDVSGAYYDAAGLAPDNRYYFRVAAVNKDGAETDYSEPSELLTLAHTPLPSGFTGVGSGALMFNWSANGNSDGAHYRVAVSTAPDPLAPGGAAVTVTDTYNLYLSTSGLAADTTYYFRAAAVNSAGVETGYTEAFATATLLGYAPASPVFGSVAENVIRFDWSANGNAAGTLYRVAISTAADPLAPAGAAATLSDTYDLYFSSAGLSPNTTYYFRVAGVSVNGVLTAYTPAASTSTLLAYSPVGAGFSGVGSSAMTFAWAANGNASGTHYRVIMAAGQDPLYYDGAAVYDTYALSLSSSGLTANTTYYFRAAGVNNDGVATSYSAVYATSTLAIAPAAGGFTGVTPSAAVFSWTAAGNPGSTLYRVAVSTASNPLVPGGAAATLSGVYALSFSTAGLAGNTTYYVRVAAVNNNGVATAYTGAASTATLLSGVPAPSGFSGMAAGSITFGWTANGLPAGIKYRVLSSTAADPLAAGGAVVVSSDTYSLSLSSSGLAGNTTYYFRVAGLNHNAAAWSYSAAASTSSLANAPVFSGFSAVTGSSIRAAWTGTGNTYPDTIYRVAASTASDPLNPSGAEVIQSDTPELYLTIGGLASQTTYYFRVAALNNDGLLSAYTAAQSTVTLNSVATKLYFQDSVTPVDATNSRYLTRSAGSSVVTYTKATVAGAVTPPTTATQFSETSGGSAVAWYSAPLDDVTIEGNVTFNIWARESSSRANATITAELLKANAAGEIQSVISSVVLSRTEISDSALQLQNWVKAPVSTALSNGDRLAARWYIDDGNFATMKSGYTVTATLGGATSGASGDSWVQVTESLAPARPSTSSIYGVAARQMSASWTLVEGATGYTLAASLSPANPPADIYASSVTAAGSATLDTPSLAPDTMHYMFVRSNGPGASSSWEAFPGTYTLLAYPPAPSGFTGVGASSMVFNWSANGNADGTLYRVAVSTAPNPLAPAGARVTSADTYALSLSTAGLAPNTTYYFRVAGVGKGGALTDYTAAASTSTLLAYPPAASGVQDLAATSMRFNWTANGNPAGTRYNVVSSTAPDPLAPAGAAAVSSDTYNTWLSTAGLSVNTTYYFRVAGLNNNGVPTAYTQAYAMATNALIPAAGAFGAVTSGGAVFNWTSGGNPAGTLYRAYASAAQNPLDPQGLPAVSSDTYGLSYPADWLSPDTTYYFRVAAIGHNGAASEYTAAAATATLLAYAPSPAGFTSVAASSLRFDWNSGGNADGTLYRVYSSTAADPLVPSGAAVISSFTYNTWLSSAGLSANTTYYFRVAGVNKNGVATAYTAAAGTSTLLGYVPASAGFSGVSSAALTFSWTSGGNPAGSLYRLLVSTAADPLAPAGAPVTSSDTYSLSLKAAGLAANTTYYFRAAGLNNNGVPTDYSQAAATSTLAAQPSGLYLSGVTTHDMQLNWDAAGNRDGTLYHVVMSTATDPLSPGTAVVSSTYTYQLFMSTSGLEANTPHYFKAAAVNNNGVYTAYSALSGATLEIGQLGTPTDAALTGVFVTSMSATWSLVAGATGYTLAASLSPANPPTAVYASSVTVGNASVSASVFSPALAADTVYYLFVRANGSEVSSAWAPLPAAATLLSKAPVFSSFSNVYYSSAQFNWSANGNPAGTLYRVYVSTAYNPLLPAGAVSSSSDTYNTWLSSSGLSSNTTYYFRVAGVNKDGVATAYTTARATSTLVSAPLAAGFGPVSASAVQFNWAANGNPYPRTRYNVAVSTAADPLAPAGAAVTSVNTYDLYFSSAGLFADTTYYFRVAAYGNSGALTAYTAPAATATLLGYAPAASAFQSVGTSSMNFSWTSGGNPAGTLYRVLSSTAPDPLAPAGALYVSSYTYELSLSTAGLASNTTYYFRVAGVNKNGVPTDYAAAAATATLANVPVSAVSTFSAVSNAGFTASWSANSNPAGTLYAVEISSAQDFSASGAYQVAAVTAPAEGTSYSFDGLVFSTTYYFRARAVNRNGIYTAPADLGSVKTAGLGSPSSVSVAAVAANSMTASWSAVPQAVGYTLAASVNPGSEPSPVYASSSTAGLGAVLDSPALALNTTYYLFVRADGAAESGPWTAFPATSTLANQPVSAASTFSAVGYSGFSVSWGANSNPLGSVRYQVQVSTAPDFNSGATDSVTFTTVPAYGPGATFSDLNNDKYYYFRVRTAYNNGNFGDWVSLGFKKTLALPVMHSAGDGVVLYGKSGTAMPQFRNYYGATNTFGAPQDIDLGGNGSLFTIRTSPLTTKQEAVGAYVKDGTLHMLCSDGTNWSEEWTQYIGGTETTRRFDIAYESSSGDVMVLYSRNAATSSELGYRTKSGTLDCGSGNWTSETALTAADTDGIVHWVKLASDRRADYDTIAAAWADANSYLSARVWNGSAWESEPSAALETTLDYVTARQDVESFDLDFESLTGNLMLAWANASGASGVNGVRVATAAYGSPYTWGKGYAPAGFNDDATNLDLAANPANNGMLLASIGNAAVTLQAAYWSGSSWTVTANMDTTCATPLAGTRLVAAGWISSNTVTRGVLAYNDSAATNIGYYVWAGTFTLQTDASAAPAFGNPQKFYDLRQDPVNGNRLLLTVSDVNGDLFAKRLFMTSAAALTWTDAGGAAALETSLSSNTVGGFSYVYWPAPPVTTYAQSGYGLFANSATTDVGAPLAAQDTMGVLASSGTYFRLRPLLHIGQVDLAAGGETFKLQFAGRGDGTCAVPTGTPSAYTDVGSATAIAFADNAPADGAALTANAADPQHGAHVTVPQSYEEANPAVTLAAAARNRDAMWDFALKENGVSAGTAYCFRLVKGDGTELNSYDVYPEVMLRPSVYLNEIYVSGDAAGDWVELYNDSPSTVPLSGWKLNYVENSITLGGAGTPVWSAQAGDYVNAYSTFVISGLAADLVGAQSYHVRILDNTGSLVDQAQWPVMSAGQSFARVRDGDPSFFWIDPTPTPGYANAVSTDALKINEAGYGQADRQFVELYNTSSVSTLTAAGYTLRNAASSANGLVFRFTRKIYPLDYALADFSARSSDGYSYQYVFGTPGLDPAGDFLALENSSGSVVDAVVWQSDGNYSLYDYRAALVSAGNFAPAGAAYSIARRPSEGYDSGSDAADFAASAWATPAARNNGAGSAAANTLYYPVNTSAPQYLASRFPLSLALGAASAGGGNNFVFQRTGGSADAGSPHIYRLEGLGFDLASTVRRSTEVAGTSFYDQDGAPLVSSAVYRVTLNSGAGSASAPLIELGTVTYYSAMHGVSASTAAPLWMNDASRAAVLRVDVANNNPAGFNALALSTVAFRLLSSDLSALTQDQARGLFNAVMLAADASTGTAGLYEPGVDVSTLAYVPMASITLDSSGLSTMTVAQAFLASAEVPAASTGTFFIVVESTRNASDRSPNVFRASFSPVSAAVADAAGGLGQAFVPAQAAQTSSVTVIAPAQPPAGTSWPYAAPASAATESPVAYYVNDGGTSVSSSVYVGSADGYLRALKKDGTLKWAYATSPLSAVRSSPNAVVEGGSVYLYFANDNGDVYKLRDDETSGALVWKQSIGARVRSGVMCSDMECTGSVIYLGAADKTVRCLNKSDGLACSGWTFASAVTAEVSGVLAIDSRDSVKTAWVGLADGKVVALQTTDGASPTSFVSGGAIVSSPYLDARVADANNVIYFTSTDGKLYARVSSNLSAMPTGWTADYQTEGASPIRTSPMVTFGAVKYIFFGDDAGRLHKVDATGAAVAGWPVQAGGAIRSSPVWVPGAYVGLAADYIYFGCDDGYIYAVNADTGERRSGWPVATGGPVRADPVVDVADRTLTVGSTDGKTYSLNIGP